MNDQNQNHGQAVASIANAYATGLALCLVFFVRTLPILFYVPAAIVAFFLYAFAAYKTRKEPNFFMMVFLAVIWLVTSQLLFMQLK